MSTLNYAATFGVSTENSKNYILIKNCYTQGQAIAKMRQYYGDNWSMIYDLDAEFEKDITKYNLRLLQTIE